MMFYLAIFCTLWGAVAITSARGRPIIALEFLALFVFVVMAGQRYETGNDWLVYREHFIGLQETGLFGDPDPNLPRFEPFYVVLTWLAGFVLNFQNFLLVVALFNGVVLLRFARNWGVSFLGVFAIYYAWLYLPTQMATIRSSIAISFVLLAILALWRNRGMLALMLMLVATGFHLFSLAFFPVFLFVRRSFDLRWAIVVTVGAYVVQYVVFRALDAGLLNGLPFSEKLALYLAMSQVRHMSLGSMAYVALNLAFFGWLVVRFGDDPRSRLAKWSVFYLLFFQIALWQLPVFWIRIQVLALVIQACVLSEIFVQRRHLLAVAGVGTISLAMMFKFLTDPALLTYLPYQSYWVDKLLLNTSAVDAESKFYEAIAISRERVTE